MKNRYIFEVFEAVCKLEDRNDRIKYLQDNASIEVKSILQLCYNDEIKLDLPKGKPPFTECPEGRQPSTLSNALKPIAQLLVGGNLDQVKKERLFISILESINAEDASIICAAKDGTITNLHNKKYRKITKSLFESAFPGLM